MSPFRGVYTLKCTAPLDHHQAERGFNGEPVLGPGLRYLNSWHSLVRHVRMCADLRVLYHTEWEKTQACSGTDSTLYSVIASKAWSPLAEGSAISTGTRWKVYGKVSEGHLTLRSMVSGASVLCLVRFGRDFESLREVVPVSLYTLVCPQVMLNAVSFVETLSLTLTNLTLSLT